MRIQEFDYPLPPERIAQTPMEPRDAARLLVLHRHDGQIDHRAFPDLLEYLTPDDLLVFNDTRVLPARLLGRKLLPEGPGAHVEVLLLKRLEGGRWEAMVNPGRRVQVGTRLEFADGRLLATILDRDESGSRVLQLEATAGEDVETALHTVGQAPLPPYIHARLEDPERYQTIYARDEGAAAAPTAGLHFTPRIFAALSERGIRTAFVTLHVGIGTFRPIRAEKIEAHEMHAEWYSVPEETAAAIAACRGRVVAVGTTTVRTLESAAAGRHQVRPGSGMTQLYITPGYRFQIVDALVTNFHTPRSSLLVMVSALAGRERIMNAYQAALSHEYRFLSFGDAMLIVE